MIGVAAMALIAVLLVANSRRVHAPGGYVMPATGPSWVTAAEGLLVCHREGRLVLLNWDLTDTGTGWARPFTHPAGFTGRAALADGVALVSCTDARLRAVDLQTGLQAWETVVGSSAAEPTAAGDGVFFGADDAKLYAVSAEDGAVRWSARLGARVASAPLVTEDRIVVGTIAGVLHCLNRGDGEKLWRATLGGPIYASPRQVGDAYLVGTDDGVLYRVALDGEMAGELQMEGIIRAPVGMHGDAVIVGDSAGVVCRIEPSTMTEMWRRSLTGPVADAPVVSDDRVWCLAGTDLVCLRAETGRPLWRRRGASQTVDCIVAAQGIYWTTADGRVHSRSISP